MALYLRLPSALRMEVSRLRLLKVVGQVSGGSGGAALQQQCVAVVAYSNWLWVGGQGQLVAGTGVAEYVATVPAVVLEDVKKVVTDPQGDVICVPTLIHLRSLPTVTLSSNPSAREILVHSLN